TLFSFFDVAKGGGNITVNAGGHLTVAGGDPVTHRVYADQLFRDPLAYLDAHIHVGLSGSIDVHIAGYPSWSNTYDLGNFIDYTRVHGQSPVDHTAGSNAQFSDGYVYDNTPVQQTDDYGNLVYAPPQWPYRYDPSQDDTTHWKQLVTTADRYGTQQMFAL